jgi:hypothetical protein
MLILFVASCSSNIKTDQVNKYEFPGLGMLIDAYYRDYYDYPKNSDEFILFCDSINTNDFETTIKKIKENKNRIAWSLGSNKIVITLNDSIIYETELRFPCDELLYNEVMYLDQILFFNTDGISINSEEIEAEFKNCVKEIKMHYSRIDEGDSETKYHLLQYTTNIGLEPFCNNDKILTDIGYFKEIEVFLNIFTKKHKLSKVIFVTCNFQ